MWRNIDFQQIHIKCCALHEISKTNHNSVRQKFIFKSILNTSSRSYSVRLGEYDEKTNPDCEKVDNSQKDLCADTYQDIIIDIAIAHPDYSQTLYTNDIGIIRLKSDAKLSQNNINTICLPFDDKGKKIGGSKYEVIGWGATSNSSAFPVLQKAALPLYDSKMCEENLMNLVKITDGQFCAGGEGKEED